MNGGSRTYITGAGGFLGRALAKKASGAITPIPHEEIENYTFGPFRDFYFLSTFGNMHRHDSDEKIIKANVLDLIGVVKKIIRYNFRSFVFASTSSVNLKVQTMYSRTKKMAEELLLAYAEKYQKPFCVIRPFSITGAGEQGEHLIPTLIRSCCEGEFMNFVGSPSHDFIDVEDVASGAVSLSKNSARGVFELGSGNSYTNQQVLELVEEITGKKANVNNVERLRNYDTDMWVSKNFRARGYGWLPKKTLRQSIKEMVDDYYAKKA